MRPGTGQSTVLPHPCRCCQRSLTENNINNLLENESHKINLKRNLDEYQPIRIHLITARLNATYENEGMTGEIQMQIINKALNQAKEALQKLINVKRNNKIQIPQDIMNQIKLDGFFIDKDSISNEYESDLVIFIRVKYYSETFNTDCLSIPRIYLREDNNGDIGRPIVGGIIYNSVYSLSNDENQRIQALKIIFLHEFTHILGFEQTILNEKKFIETIVSNRIDDKYITKKVIISERVLTKAKEYFNCSKIKGIELDTENILEGNEFIHWEGRLLLGEYMTSELYYPEQVISEFTLALLEDLGWYKVNYYTGGLMKFGKYKGCEFINGDCVIINEGIISSRFPNDFCSLNTFGTCSAGRQSRGYCYTETSVSNVENKGFKRKGWEEKYGIAISDYCPATFETKITKNSHPYYIGSCKYGNNNYGNEMKVKDDLSYSYNEFSDNFVEKYGDDSFCLLSSIKKKK